MSPKVAVVQYMIWLSRRIHDFGMSAFVLKHAEENDAVGRP